MRKLYFKVVKQKLQKNGNFYGIISGTSGYLSCEFSFCDEWKTLLKVAEFRKKDNGEVFPVKIIGNTCMVPKEVTDGTQWYITVIGKNEQKTITTNRVKVAQEV